MRSPPLTLRTLNGGRGHELALLALPLPGGGVYRALLAVWAAGMRAQTCAVCATPIQQPRQSGRPRRFCSKAHARIAYRQDGRLAASRARCRANAQARQVDVYEARPEGPLPDPYGLLLLTRAVYVQAWRDHEQAWLADHAAQGVWRAILRAALVEGMD